MSLTHPSIRSRVSLEDWLGPFDCYISPTDGWLRPRFDLEGARELSSQTVRMAAEDGFDSMTTIHIVDGRADSGDTVHLVEGGPDRYSESDDPMVVALRIRWTGVGQDPVHAVSISHATPKDIKAARKRKVSGRGPRRAVVVQVEWQWLFRDGDATSAVDICPPRPDGLYGVGDGHWPWTYVEWTCACGSVWNWHEDQCGTCDLTRDGQPEHQPTT
ncbi:hypothetical protein ACFYY2_31525 [Streptomyces sp. NPDC001822]|uniref:hypothetical protein n=1 Tax=Streptomyces sp. NPDC001822 TaxID=3364614 RepID=UPI0036B98369